MTAVKPKPDQTSIKNTFLLVLYIMVGGIASPLVELHRRAESTKGSGSPQVTIYTLLTLALMLCQSAVLVLCLVYQKIGIFLIIVFISFVLTMWWIHHVSQENNSTTQ